MEIILSGILFVTATPIGNMSDMSERAIETLKNANLVLAEDTRETIKLFNRFGIKTRLESYHKFSEKKELQKYIALLENGEKIALVSDAGTPAVSDPGKYLVNEALLHGIRVIPIPGASAAMAAFSASGCMSNSFVFAGFLSSKGAQRKTELENFLLAGLPVVIYESPNRIKDLIELLKEASCRIVVGRELTKHFEEVFLFDGREITEKGEFTVIAEPFQKKAEEIVFEQEVLDIIEKYKISSKDAQTILTKIYPEAKQNLIKKAIYEIKENK